MLQEDLEKRLEEIEMKIEELEDMILDNRLKIMDIFTKIEKKVSHLVRVGETNIEKPEEMEVVKIGETKKPKGFFKPKKEARPEEIEDLKNRAKKIKNMLRELE